MHRRPPPTAEEIEIAFARNIAWLAKMSDRLPRHMVLNSHLVDGIPWNDRARLLIEWSAILEPMRCGDFRMTPAARDRVSHVARMSHGVSERDGKSPEIRESMSQSHATSTAPRATT